MLVKKVKNWFKKTPIINYSVIFFKIRKHNSAPTKFREWMGFFLLILNYQVQKEEFFTFKRIIWTNYPALKKWNKILSQNF